MIVWNNQLSRRKAGFFSAKNMMYSRSALGEPTVQYLLCRTTSFSLP